MPPPAQAVTGGPIETEGYLNGTSTVHFARGSAPPLRRTTQWTLGRIRGPDGFDVGEEGLVAGELYTTFEGPGGVNKYQRAPNEVIEVRCLVR